MMIDPDEDDRQKEVNEFLDTLSSDVRKLMAPRLCFFASGDAAAQAIFAIAFNVAVDELRARGSARDVIEAARTSFEQILSIIIKGTQQ